MAAMTFILGSAEVLRDNTAQTFLPTVVEKPQLEQANGALWSTEQLAGQFIGPPLAGFLIGLSVALPFGVQTVLLLAAIGLIGAMRLPRRAVETAHQPVFTAMREGLGWLWRDTVLRRLALVSGLFNFVGYGFFAIFVLYAQQVLGLDAVIAPIGGGGMVSGTCLTLSTVAPGIRIYAAEPSQADDAYRSFKAGHIIADDAPKTVADGLKVPLKDLTWHFVQRHVSDILTVSEAEIIEAMKLIWKRMKIVMEPSSAVPLATILKNPEIEVWSR